MTDRKIEERGCPDCFEGTVWEPCAACGGNGCDPAGTEKDCPKCEGAGEQPMRRCATCCGTGRVTYALMRLAEADRWVRTNCPEWDGDNRSHNGVTLFSTAEWFRRRCDFQALVMEAPVQGGECVLRLYGSEGKRKAVIDFTGFGYGYGGEGPHGLAAVMADAFPEDFPTFELAMAFVQRQPFGSAWTFSAGDGRNADVLHDLHELGEVSNA